MEDIVMKDNIIQKPIKLISWKIMAACRRYCRTIKPDEDISTMDILQELLKEELAREENLSYEKLYSWLIETILDVCSINQIENILRFDIKELLKKIENYQLAEYFNGKRKKGNIINFALSYEELCKMLINKLSNLKTIKKLSDNNKVDLFIICTDDGKLISIEEAENEWLGENVIKRTLTQNE
jgi:hypothetical protein